MIIFIALCSFKHEALARVSVDISKIRTAPERAVTGKVVAQEDGAPLVGVSVAIKGVSGGTVTDMNGAFSLNIPDNGAVLVLTYLGYTAKEVAVSDQSTLRIVMTQNSHELSQVVVIGYGTIKKSDLTGAVSSVGADELKAVPVTSFDQALQGRAAGVQVTQTTGAPGGETNIRIRGTSSVNASSEPLYVIDGMLVNSNGAEMSVGGVGPRIGALSTINPNDIASIEVLKDASATAIYGSRGANGVILITTKRGKEGKGAVNFESYYGVQEVANKLDLLNAEQFAGLVNEAAVNAGRVPVYVNPATLGEGTDWQQELFRVAQMANYQLSFTGGNAQTKYAVSGGYFTQDGIVIGSDFDRYSFRVNLDTEINDKLSVGSNLSYNRLSSNGVLTGPGTIIPGVISNALQFNPIAPVYDPNEASGYTYEHLLKTNIANPVAEAREYESITSTSRILGNVFAQYKLLEGLAFRTSFGIDGLNAKSNAFGPNFLKRTQGSKGEAVISTLDALTWLNTNTLTYDKEINARNRVNALAGFEVQQFRNESLSAVAFDFPDSRTGWHNLGGAQNPQNPANGELAWSMRSYFGRVNYSLDDRFLFTLSSRVDGSSKFAAGNKYGFFPSAAFAWRVSEENFMKGVTFINDLKLRVSYGWTGNQSISPYQSLALITPFGEGVFNGPDGSVVYRGQEPVSYPNKDLKWETTEQTNIGMDLSVLEGKIGLTAEVYVKNTDDLLLSTPIPFTTGFGSTLLNVGNVQNRGVDLELNTINIDRADSRFSWNTALNFSVNRNKVTNLAREEDINLGFGGNILRTGEPIGTFYGYVFDGIFQSNGEAASSPKLVGQQSAAGDRRYKDISGPDGTPDGVINDFDRTIIGSAQADFTWGLNNEVSFRNFSLSFFFQGSQGNELVNMNLINIGNVNGQQNVLAEAGLNRWTPENPGNRYARALATSTDNVFSSRFVEDASYLRLKNVTFSYKLPAAVLNKLGISQLKLYASSSNLWTLTDYSGYDPEANAYGYTNNLVGVDDGTYPQAKTHLLGLNLTF
jgi:TonB-linked SusC/RagA family outer membrane protein